MQCSKDDEIMEKCQIVEKKAQKGGTLGSMLSQNDDNRGDGE